jgi:hypothetical protein
VAAQVTDFLMRVKSRRFPSIEKDMKMVLAHCGSLFLDPASLWQVFLDPCYAPSVMDRCAVPCGSHDVSVMWPLPVTSCVC